VTNSLISSAWQSRFGGVARLYGVDALSAFAKAHVVIVGVGGVGTWAAEALIRSGIGTLTLIDLDDICITNTNRQSHALQSTIGQSKVSVLQKRLLDINPEATLHGVDDFLTVDNMSELITPRHHIVLDAMDMAHTKAALIAYCSARKIGIVTVGSAGGKFDPSLVTYSDLARSEYDPLLAKIRHNLYKIHGFSKERHRKFRVDAVFSKEAMRYPQPDGSVSTQKNAMQDGAKLDCASGFGASTMVTGTFGFVAASRVLVRYLARCSRALES